MADCTGLENRRAARYRGFESPPLRVQSDGRCKHLKYSALQRPFFIGTLNCVKTEPIKCLGEMSGMFNLGRELIVPAFQKKVN